MEVFLAIVFYLITCLFSLVGLFFARQIFQNKVLVYVSAKFVGLLLFGYVVWLLASLRILNYQNVWVISILLLLAVLASLLGIKRYRVQSTSSHPQVYEDVMQILKLEVVGLAVYLGYLFLRAHNAEINGTERFMDMALLSASGNAHYFPFIDPWYAGKTVNYYYYGAYLMSLLSNLAHLPYALTYNFALGFIYTQAFLLAGGLIYAIGKSKVFAGLGALVLTSAGTLFFANCVLQNWLKGVQTCSYASSTRLFSPSYIINEIPSYSFTVGDLHAHLLALPVFLLGLSLLYALWITKKPSFGLLLILVVLLASLGLINPWDLITLSCLFVLVVFFKVLPLVRAKDWLLVKDWLLFLGVTMFFTFALMWPGTRSFHNPVLGLGFAPSFVKVNKLVNVQWPTPLTAEVGMWGVFILLCAYLWIKRSSLPHTESIYLFCLSLLSLGIIGGVELFFVMDIYSVANPSYFRANTTFKFGYHVWSMLSVVFFAGLGLLFGISRKRIKLAMIGFTGMALLGGIAYPAVAIRQFYLSNASRPTLNGASWMKRSSPEDLATINYINAYIKERSVIAEAVGNSYSTYSRITTFSGQITPMGWQTHEWTWRFKPVGASSPSSGQTETGWSAVSKVAGDMKILYETASKEEAKAIIARYGIQYIYVGGLERTTYPALDERKFAGIANLIFSLGTSKLYAVDN